jgi:hypothetical protein
LDRSLLVAALGVAQDYAARGGSRLVQTTTLSVASGQCSLVSLAPLAIHGVRWQDGSALWSLVPQVSAADIYQDFTVDGTIAIEYVATPALPTSTNNMQWAGLTMPLLDELTCIKAARLCLVKDKELDQSLNQQYNEFMNTVINNDRQSPTSKFPNKRASSLYTYSINADVIKLHYTSSGASVQR